jgi:hypothetical protein
MPPSHNRAAYEDCYALLDRALASKRGVQKICSSQEEALYLRGRLNQARTVDRRQNALIYEPGHPLHNHSEYYKVSIKVEEDSGRWLCKLEKNIIRDAEVEEIPDFEEEGPILEEMLTAVKEKEDERGGLDTGGDLVPGKTGGDRLRRF